MKTPMQELIDKLKEEKELNQETIQEFLEKERHQIMSAWADGCFNSKPGDCGMNYFKNKFNNYE